jgi:predicted MFS family arabinose efflux permease
VAGLSDAYLPLYVQTTRGQSASVAAFSVLFVTVGWTSSAFIVSRLLDRWREVDAILLGAILIVPSVAAAGVTVAWDLPLATVFASFFVMGMAIGFVSTAGLTLLQSSSSDTEMGRVNSAHQFIRTLGITFSVTVGGAILLTVVDFQVGDVEAVRQVLSGDEVDAGSETLAAIGDGLTAVMGFAWLMSVGCLWSAWTLRRRMSSLSSDSGLSDG